MQVTMLGPLEVRDGAGRQVVVGGSRLRALLARLALEPGRVVTVDALIDSLWGDNPPSGAVNALQSLVSRLRRVLAGPDQGHGQPGLVESRPVGYRLCVEPEQVDAHRFERLAAEGRTALVHGSAGDASRLLRDAERLWQGPALADLVDAPFAGPAATRLSDIRLAATEDRLEADLILARHGEVVAELETLALTHPLRERLQGQLIRALYACGRQSDALRAYERLRTSLADELGIDPSAELADLHLAVLRQDPDLRTAARPEARVAPADQPVQPVTPSGRTRLRAQITSFVGRDKELRRLAKLLDDARLVTVVGPGGAGKTRLATELAGRLPLAGKDGRDASSTPDGLWLVELAGVTNPHDVVQAVLSAVGVREPALPERTPVESRPPRRDAMTMLVEALAHRRALLLLDNCEHVVDAAARLADELLAACPSLRILATSREPLAVAGEVLYTIPPLAWPPAADPTLLSRPTPAASASEVLTYPAVRLFADRASAADPDFDVTLDNSAAVVEICRRLDGMPLAIELAAAKVRSLSVAQIAARLDDRFRLLTSGSRTALARHQTLRAVIEWSWELLDEPERILARRLAVFPGGVTVEAAEQICADPAGSSAPALAAYDILGVLGALVDKSLLETVVDERTGGGVRYRMLETVRAYAAERLAEAAESDRLHAAHAGYFTVLAETAEPLLRSASQLEWMRRLRAEQGNLLAALRWAIDSADADIGVRLCASLLWFWFIHGNRTESIALAEEVLPLSGAAPPAARAILLMFHAVGVLSKGDVDGATVAINKAVEQVSRADTAQHPVLLLVEPMTTLFLHDRDQTLARLNAVLPDLDPWGRALALFFRGAIEDNEGNAETARSDMAAALEAFRATGDRWGLAMTIRAVAANKALDGDHAGAIEGMQEAVALVRELGSLNDVPEILVQIAQQRVRSGDVETARAEIAAALKMAEESGQHEGVVWARCGAAEVAALGGDLATARRELQRALSTYDAGGFTPPQVRAIVLTALACVDLVEGDLGTARRRLDSAITLALAPHDMPILAGAVHVLAGHTMLSGDPEQAAVLLGMATTLRGVRDQGSPDLLRTEDRVREQLGSEAYDRAYAEGAGLAREDAIARVRPASFQPPGQSGSGGGALAGQHLT